MARQLQDSGRHVPLLVLLDCYNHAWRPPTGIHNIVGSFLRLLATRARYHWRNLNSGEAGGKLAYLGDRARAFVSARKFTAGQAVYDYCVDRGRPLPSFLRSLGHANCRASRRYVPRPYGGPVLLIRVPGLRPDAPLLGWKGILTGRVELHDIAFHHRGLLSEPGILPLVELLRSRLPAAGAGQ